MNTLTWGAAPSDSPVYPPPAVSVCASLGVFSSLPCYPSKCVPGAILDTALMKHFSYLEQKPLSFSFALDPVDGV